MAMTLLCDRDGDVYKDVAVLVDTRGLGNKLHAVSQIRVQIKPTDICLVQTHTSVLCPGPFDLGKLQVH